MTATKVLHINEIRFNIQLHTHAEKCIFNASHFLQIITIRIEYLIHKALKNCTMVQRSKVWFQAILTEYICMSVIRRQTLLEVDGVRSVRLGFSSKIHPD